MVFMADGGEDYSRRQARGKVSHAAVNTTVHGGRQAVPVLPCQSARRSQHSQPLHADGVVWSLVPERHFLSGRVEGEGFLHQHENRVLLGC